MTLNINSDNPARISKALAILAPLTKRQTIPSLAGVLISGGSGSATFSATDLDCYLTFTESATVESDGRALVNALALADAVKAIAKVKGAHIGLRVGADDSADAGKLIVYSGRTRLALALIPADDFPAAIDAWEADETVEALAKDAADVKAEPGEYDNGVARVISETAAKILAKALKLIGPDSPAIIERRTAIEDKSRFRMVADGCTFSAMLEAAPYYYKSAKRDRFSDGFNATAESDATAYLRSLRASLELPEIREDAERRAKRETCSYGSQRTPTLERLITGGGYALGITFGESFGDYQESRLAPDGFAPPEGTDVEISGCMESCTIDGVDYHRFTDKPWHFRYVPEQSGEVYQAGSYSLPMPLEQRQPLTALTVDVDGVPHAVRAVWNGDSSGAIEMTAEQVRELCGPVDPSNFVELPTLALHQGRVLATGDRAAAFNALQRGHFDRLAKIRKAPRSPERLESYASECASFAPVIAALIEGADVLDAAIEAAGGLPAEPVAIEQTPAVEPEPVAIAETPAVEPAPDPAPAIEAEPMPAAPAAPPAPVAALATPSDLEARLARLEAALGLETPAKRTPAHAAAIKRAWAMRRAMRERADLDSRALDFANRYARSLAEESGRLADRIEKAESFASERAELIATIDGLRAETVRLANERGGYERRANSLYIAKRRLARRGAAMRRDIARTRAERDGMAANVQAMSRRVAEDAAAIDRLQPVADRPRFIMSAR